MDENDVKTEFKVVALTNDNFLRLERDTGLRKWTRELDIMYSTISSWDNPC